MDNYRPMDLDHWTENQESPRTMVNHKMVSTERHEIHDKFDYL